VILRRQFLHRHARHPDALLADPHFEVIRHDVTFPAVSGDRRDLPTSRAPRRRSTIQYDPVQTTKTSVHGAINRLGLAAHEGEDPAGLHERGSTATLRCTRRRRTNWGNVNAGRPALVLRRGQALRGDAVLRLIPPATRCGSRSPGSSTRTVAKCTPSDGRVVSELRRAGAERTHRHDLRNGSQNALVLLRRTTLSAARRLMDTGEDVTGPINSHPEEYRLRRSRRPSSSSPIRARKSY